MVAMELADEFVRPRVALRVNNGDMMRDAALAGLGLALMPSFIVGTERRDRGVGDFAEGSGELGRFLGEAQQIVEHKHLAVAV